jgi:hypothetical protein
MMDGGRSQHVLGQVRDDGVERGLTSFSRSSAAYAASPAEISPSWILAANSVFQRAQIRACFILNRLYIL